MKSNNRVKGKEKECASNLERHTMPSHDPKDSSGSDFSCGSVLPSMRCDNWFKLAKETDTEWVTFPRNEGAASSNSAAVAVAAAKAAAMTTTAIADNLRFLLSSPLLSLSLTLLLSSGFPNGAVKDDEDVLCLEKMQC